MSRLTLSVACILFEAAAYAQFGRGFGEWSTSGADAQRSSWIRTDPKISKDRIQKGEFQLLWKMKLENRPRELNLLTTVAILDRYIGYRGFRSLGFVGGSSDTVYGIDTDLARMEWQKHFPSKHQPPTEPLSCVGGVAANVSRQVPAAFPITPMGLGEGPSYGRSGPARSVVGEPGNGAVTLAAANQPPRPGSGSPGPRPGRAGVFKREPVVMYALSTDGMLHTMYVSNGEEPAPPLQFLPANANVLGFIVVGKIAYAATSGGCVGVPDGVWALDLTSKEVAHWLPDKGSIAGLMGPAFGPDGTVYIATARELAALDPKTLKVKDSYHAGGLEFTSSPVVFSYKERTLLATTTKDGRIHLLDSATLSSALYKTPAASNDFGKPEFVPDALASWQDSAAIRWVLAPDQNAVVAWKVAEHDGTLSLQRGWVSPDMASPLTPIIINGVVFAVSSREPRSHEGVMTTAERLQRSSPAVLYALDGTSGKELWNSGKTITSLVHNGRLSGGESQLYLGTYDGTLYAFGFPIEH